LKKGFSASLGFLLFLTGSASFGQESIHKQLPPVRKVSPAPLSHLYMHFLLYQNHLDRAAAAREAEGKDGSWLRNYLQERTGLTSSEFAVVRKSALRLESNLKENRAQVAEIAQANRAVDLQDPSRSSAGRIQTSQFKDLQDQREKLIQDEIGGLDQGLGPQAAARLRDFLQNHFVRNVDSSTVPPNHHMHLPPMYQPKAVQP
jgi:hypothetical protein